MDESSEHADVLEATAKETKKPSSVSRVKKVLRNPKLYTVLGTTILLSSWIVEHYWAAQWSAMRYQFESVREGQIQIDIHEGVAATMLQYTAGLHPFNQRLLTTGDMGDLITMFDMMATQMEALLQGFTTDVPLPDTGFVRDVIAQTLVADFPSEMQSILEGGGDEELTIDQIWVAGDLVDMLNRWANAHQMFQAVYQLFDTTISRLQRNEDNALSIPDGEAFARRFAALRETLEARREQFFKTAVLLESASNYVDEANSLRLEFGVFLRDRGEQLSSQESYYKSWHRAMYLIGSLLLLCGFGMRK